MSSEELLRDRILGPLGVTMTGITQRPAMTRRFALPHEDELEIVIRACQAGDTLPQQHAVLGQRDPDRPHRLVIVSRGRGSAGQGSGGCRPVRDSAPASAR